MWMAYTVRRKERDTEEMEYYAKSPVYGLSAEEREHLLEQLDRIPDALGEELNENDHIVLQGYQKKLLSGSAIDEHKTLRDHLEETVQCAEDFFHIYGSYFTEKEKGLILSACGIHDVGKANCIFQSKVSHEWREGQKGRAAEIPHGFLSAFIMSEKIFCAEHPDWDADDFSAVLTAVYYHHNRRDVYEAKELETYCEQYYLDYVREYSNDETIAACFFNKNKLLFSTRTDTYQDSVEEDLWCEYMLIKGLLNKFDWTVSAGYDRAEIAADIEEKELRRNVEAALSGGLRPAQRFMSDNKDRNVVVIAPTGSGKTEAALLWLNGEKGFYTLPLKVSSNAIYDRIREKYRYRDVALLHSDSMNSYLLASEGDIEDGYRNYEQAKLLSYPLTVCTVDQLFRFVYKALGTEVFAATLKYSKIIIDEIQSYSPKIVAALIFGLKEVKKMGGKFAIITATFPPVLQHFMKKNKLMEDRDCIYRDFSDMVNMTRHRIAVVEDDFNIDRIVEDADRKKVLVICNTVSKAQQVYQEIRDRDVEAGLLHSRYTRADREVLEKRIMDFSENKPETGVWVTTQIVEASLDIDFDTLHTEMCTADSLLQRMGRCNRAGEKDTDVPNVIVYYNNAGRGTVYDKDIYDRSADLLRKYAGEIISEADKTRYINEVYDVTQIKRTKYFRQIEENLKHFQALMPSEYDAQEAKEDFRAIRSITVIPDIVYQPNRSLIEEIKNFISTPHMDKGVRQMLKSRLISMTLSLNINYGIPQGIDRSTIGIFDIHRTSLKYDFDGQTGLGLLLDKTEDESCFI